MTSPQIDVDNLPPTQYLILEVLAARHRLGEALWTFPSGPAYRTAADRLAQLGIVGWKSGVAPKTIQVWFTDAGRKMLPADPAHLSPNDKAIRMARAEVAEDIGDAILTHFAPDNRTARQAARIARHHATAYDTPDEPATATSPPLHARPQPTPLDLRALAVILNCGYEGANKMQDAGLAHTLWFMTEQVVALHRGASSPIGNLDEQFAQVEARYQ